MNKNQILMTMLAAIFIAAITIFTGCNKYKADVTGVTVCPVAVMVTVGDNTTLTEIIAYFPETEQADLSVTWVSDKSSVASVDGTGKVTTHAVGEAIITCKTTDGGYAASAKVIVNPKEADDVFATLVPSFYFGNTKINGATVDLDKLVTVKYYLGSKIIYSINEKFTIPRTGGYMELWLKADVVADITKIEEYTYHAVCEANLNIDGAQQPAILHLDGTFTPDVLDLIINIKGLPNMDEVTLNFKGTGKYMIDCPVRL
ncbi:MAG: Ig-like domain-containing protein [Lentimicrobiaceae bacterium]|nr:Ig-like domain-containing protein [Lentimicrobiaceae bacterium]